MRASAEARVGERVLLGAGVSRDIHRFLPPGVHVTERGSNGSPVDLALITADQIDSRGQLVAPSSANGHANGSDVLPAGYCAGRLVVLLTCPSRTRRLGIVPAEPAARRGSTGPHADRIISALAVIDVTEHGLVVRELAPGISAREVQQASGATLLAEPSLTEIGPAR